jgi:nicotinate-nucleotide pyrophosphorylase (carboxylating)
VSKQFRQIAWDNQTSEDWQQLLRLAVREDLDRFYDWTTTSLVASNTPGSAAVVARESGVVAGMEAARMTLAEYDNAAQWDPQVNDGDPIQPGQHVAQIRGAARAILSAERILLNVLGRLSGVATFTRQYVEAVRGTNAGIYDTRKTTPGWRRLEKYAVRMGGGHNHRGGLHEAVLIKDNHLALGGTAHGSARFTPAEAVSRCREALRSMMPGPLFEAAIVEIEVDTLEQLESVLPAGPDIVLLDNMSADLLRQAVARRDALAPEVELEASGGVNLSTVAGIAASGVERISVGALTHSATSLDFGLDWELPGESA